MEEKIKKAFNILIGSDNHLKKKAVAFLVKSGPDSIDILSRALEYQEEPSIKHLIEKAISLLSETKISFDSFDDLIEKEKIELLKKGIKNNDTQQESIEFMILKFPTENEIIKYFILRTLIVFKKTEALNLLIREFDNGDKEYREALFSLAQKFDDPQILSEIRIEINSDDQAAVCGSLRYIIESEMKYAENLIDVAINCDNDDIRIEVFKILEEYAKEKEDIKEYLDNYFNSIENEPVIDDTVNIEEVENDSEDNLEDNKKIENVELVDEKEKNKILNIIKNKIKERKKGLLSFIGKAKITEEIFKLYQDTLNYEEELSKINFSIGKKIYLEYVQNISRNNDLEITNIIRTTVTVEEQLKNYKIRLNDLKEKAGGGIMKIFQKNLSSLNIYENKISYLNNEIERYFSKIGDLIIKKIDINEKCSEYKIYKKEYENSKELLMKFNKCIIEIKKVENI